MLQGETHNQSCAKDHMEVCAKENWMAEVTSELTTRCPTVAKILSSLLDCDLTNPGKKLPPMCLLYGVILFLRCHELSRIQRINTVLLVQGKATTKVCSV